MKKPGDNKLSPRVMGPYSPVVLSGGFLFISGQIPVDPETREVVRGEILLQTEVVMNNIKTLLESSNADMNSIVKTTVYLSNMEYFADMNKVYGRFFESPYPARATVSVNALPKGVDIEIEAIACLQCIS